MATPGALRVVEREAQVFRRLWRGSVFSSVVAPVLFLAAMGVGLGGLVDEGTRDLGGLDYLAFVAPGLLVASAMQTAAGESLWPVMAGHKWIGTFHAMAATPLRPGDVFVGFVAWNGVRVAGAATIFLLVAVVLGAVPSWWAPLAIPAATLCGVAFSAMLAAFAVRQDSDVSFSLIMRLGVLPLFLFSGTFFPVEQLPDPVEPFVVLSPLWHGVELARGATTGSIDAGAAAGHTAVLVVVTALATWWGAAGFRRRLSP
ncbi:MAG: ABC transporter permease [Acidimicrobiales bacterium]